MPGALPPLPRTPSSRTANEVQRQLCLYLVTLTAVLRQVTNALFNDAFGCGLCGINGRWMTDENGMIIHWSLSILGSGTQQSVDEILTLPPGRPGVRIPVRTRHFLFLQNVQTDLDTHPASYSMCNGTLSSDKASETWSSPLTLYTVEIMNEWSYTSTSHMPSWRLSLARLKFDRHSCWYYWW
jgi:hypothetical protein